MADVVGNILLTTSGGDESAAEVNKATQALDGISASSSNLQKKFQERFEHIGLHVFAGQALQSIGLSGETRQAVMLLNTALRGAETAAGISSGGLTLLVTALVAVGAAVYEVVEKHKSLIETLDKTHDAEQKQTQATMDVVSSIDKYQAAGGKLTPTLQAWLTAEEHLQKAQVAAQEATDRQTISALRATIAQEKMGFAVNATFSEKVLTMIAGFTQGTALSAIAVERLAKDISAQNMTYEKQKVQLKELEAELEALQKGYGTTAQAGVQGALKELQGRKTAETGMKAAIDAEHAHERQIADQRLQMWIKEHQQELKEEDKHQKAILKSVNATTMEIGKDFGAAFAQVIVQGGDMADALTKAAQRMADQFIESTIEMIIYWTALRAVMSVMGQGAAFQGMAQLAYPGISSMMYGQASSTVTKQATGGSMFADTPTPVIFGEGGPEVATFSPLSGGNATSGGGAGIGGEAGVTQNNEINITIQGGMVDQNTINKIGQVIVQAIRGQGQVSFS